MPLRLIYYCNFCQLALFHGITLSSTRLSSATLPTTILLILQVLLVTAIGAQNKQTWEMPFLTSTYINVIGCNWV